MLQYDFEASIGYWLTLTAQGYHRTLNDELAPHGITYRQFQVLAWLMLVGDLAQTDLAARMMIEPPTLVGILDRMEKSGWISRCECTEDRRRKLIHLNPGAEEVWSKMVEVAKRVRAQATEGFTPDEVNTLIHLLGKLHRNVAKVPIEEVV